VVPRQRLHAREGSGKFSTVSAISVTSLTPSTSEMTTTRGEVMAYERVSLQFNGNVAVLKFNHPDVLNAIGQHINGKLTQALREVSDKGARCWLLTGEGRGFSSGANLADRNSAAMQGAGAGLRSGYHPLLLSIRDLQMPVVTAVNGAAAGVGMSFAMMGDIVC